MPGFPLAAIGAGLGLFAKQYQEQQAAKERNMMLQMQLQRFQQEQQDRQQQQQQASLEFGLRGGDTSVQPTPGSTSAVAPISGGFPGGGSMPQSAPSPRPMGGGGRMRAGGGLSIQALTDAALKAGFPPDKAPIVAATFMGESGGRLDAYNPNDPHGGSFGVGQINGVHPGARDTMGNLDLSMKKAFEISKGGTDFSPWSVYKSGAYRSYMPTGGTGQGRTAPSAMPSQEGYTPQSKTDAGSDFANDALGYPTQGGSPPAVTSTPGGTNGIVPTGAPRGQQMAQAGPQPATDAGPQEQNAPLPGDLRQRLNKIIPPEANGRMSEGALKAKIDQLCPNCPPIVKLKALDAEVKRMAPLEQERFKVKMEQYKTQLDAETKMWEHETRRGERAEDREERQKLSSSGQIYSGGPDKPLVTVDPNHPERGARPIPGTEGLHKEGVGGQKSSHNVEVTDDAGKVIFSGSAHQSPQGWVADKDNQPVSIPESGNIKILGTGGQGRQAAAQIQSMIGASSELVGEARNLMELPATATAGVFQGLQGIPASQLGDTLKRTLANKLTPEESTDMATSFQGVARSLATIEAQGRATGLVGLTGMSQGLIPQTGDTIGNIWRKYATLRQIMERNIDAIEASPNASVEQKGLLKKLREEMEGVIPFTVSEVNKMQHGDAQSFAQAARKAGLGGKGAAAAPKPGDLVDGYIFKGGNPADRSSWTKAPEGAVPTR